MSELFFVFKTFIITLVLILVMQIKIGKTTLETQSLRWLRDSVAVDGLRGVAEGAVAVSTKAWGFLSASISGAVAGTKDVVGDKTENASKGYSWEIKRSEAYHKQKAREKERDRQEDTDGPMGDEVD